MDLLGGLLRAVVVAKGLLHGHRRLHGRSRVGKGGHDGISDGLEERPLLLRDEGKE